MQQKRFVVHEAVIDEFTERFISEMQSQVLGDPLDRTVTMGPMARNDLRAQLKLQVESCINAGAKILFKLNPPESNGFFFGPMVLGNNNVNSPALREELFGPSCCTHPRKR